ncbi:MAG TPA: DUF4115 domain-containing protein [Acidimicrobiales bacterium]|nr:DUF4115 domain-containing protein [Acidimicrobiales bacterium]
MTGLVVIPILVLVLAVPLIRWVRSRRRDEKSIEAHRSTLGVIEHVAGVDEQPGRLHDHSAAHVRIVGSPTARAPRPAEEPVPWTARSRSRRPTFPRPRETTLQPPPLSAPEPDRARRRPAVINREIARQLAARVQLARTSAEQAPSPPPSAPHTPVRRHSRRPLLTPSAAGPNLSVILASVAAALVMAAVIGIALNSHWRHPSHSPAAVTSPRHVPGHPPAPTASSTTLPQPAVVATSTNSSYAAYTVNATNLDVTLVAAGPCWVELRDGNASGPVVYEGTLRAGVSQVFHAAGAIWLRLGDPGGVKLAIDGSPLALPAASNPFDVTVTGPAGA